MENKVELPPHLRWPRQNYCGCNCNQNPAPAERRHGLAPGTLEILPELALNFIYGFIPVPPVSVVAPLACAAARRPKAGDTADRISALTDDILRRIVSRLPAKDGARTAALSSRWTGVWCSAPLVLVDAHFLPLRGEEGVRPPRRGALSRAVTNAFSAALAAHPGPFSFVSLTCAFLQAAAADRAVLARWFTLLATKGVKELVFVNRPWPVPGLRLPAALFSCASLRRLWLGAWVFPDTTKLPRGVSFPNLQELALGAIVMEDRDFEFLLAACPVLEVLSVIGSLERSHGRLASHSLKLAQFCMCMFQELTVVSTPCLERLFIWRCCWTQRRSPKVKIGHVPKLNMLGYLEPGVQILEIGNTVIKSGTSPSPRTTVPSVKILALHLHFNIRNEVKMLPSFLRCFPNAETLCIESKETLEPTGALNKKFWKETAPIECIQSHLKMLVLREFQGEQSELDFLMFVAENARVLEKMVLVMKQGYAAEREVAARFKALDSARWASGDSKLKALVARYPEFGGTVWCPTAGADPTFHDPFFCL
ncbi:hypothetical protein EJB05_54536, partial [Eragrostis curvula]